MVDGNTRVRRGSLASFCRSSGGSRGAAVFALSGVERVSTPPSASSCYRLAEAGHWTGVVVGLLRASRGRTGEGDGRVDADGESVVILVCSYPTKTGRGSVRDDRGAVRG